VVAGKAALFSSTSRPQTTVDPTNSLASRSYMPVLTRATLWHQAIKFYCNYVDTRNI
jgi:hypothetical protein